MNARIIATLPALLLLACSAQEQTGPGTDPRGSVLRRPAQTVVYGEDDRRDYYDHPDQALRDLTRQSIVGMMDPGSLERNSDGTWTVNAQALGPSYGLCRSERFYSQPTAASCSGTLIDDDKVLTAGHCVDSAAACRDNIWVFNYYMESGTDLAEITDDDVYECAEVLAQQTSTRSTDLDYAIIRLDRPATPRHQPAAISRESAAMGLGDPVTIIGFGSGLPAKIDNGGVVLDPLADSLEYFFASTDSFGGNSGSGVFNTDRTVVGILVNGDEDYAWAGNCLEVNVLPDRGGARGGEGVTYAFQAVRDLCTSGATSARLCDSVDQCGDAFCGPTEDEASCPTDCGSTCGNGQCDARDAEGCPEECGDAPPTAWSCADENYAAGDGCDCACGAFDPDCEVPRADIYNCFPGEVCDAAGDCAAPGDDTGVASDSGTTDDAGTAGGDDASGPTADTRPADDAASGDTGVAPADAAESDRSGRGTTDGCSAVPVAGAGLGWLPTVGAALWFTRRRRTVV